MKRIFVATCGAIDGGQHFERMWGAGRRRFHAPTDWVVCRWQPVKPCAWVRS